MSEEEKKYYKGVGRRKTSSARVRVYPEGEGKFEVNQRSLEDYFSNPSSLKKAKAPLEISGLLSEVRVSVLVEGGGFNGQAEAVRHGLARALVELNPDFKEKMKEYGFLTRDPRMKERKKPGLKGARRAPQWQKR